MNTNDLPTLLNIFYTIPNW